ncbi:late secretory pathway protein AVL9 homolog [Gigantopelta aegis]|uniref:late secretory pathway protein AVL9 homolog n=1 Tax=Gigantopelta aegis TaxID=1735272 RepID=UPI001B88B29B|nr:late secretory pathway protein AVL9 homolog [Gigantopelta aegis]
MAGTKKTTDSPILHVVVIGFHHKKGCQVEYSYPPLISGNAVDSHDLPKEWKHLPSLSLPDGAHNFEKDTVFFHLPARDGQKKTVYGISCYRQMDAKDLLNKTADITRSTVQKSVCVLSRLPLYGLIEAKLELITHAYFDERDFSKVEILRQIYNNLCDCLTESDLDGCQVFLGLSAREAVHLFKHKIVLLFKLILLERKVLFFGSPVQALSSTLLSVLSLFPGMIEFGLKESAVETSSDLQIAKADDNADDSEGFLEVKYVSNKNRGNSALPEVLQHMHNDTPTEYSTSEEPQSPTIPRGDPVNSAPDKNNVSQSHTDTENNQSKLSMVSADPKPKTNIPVFHDEHAKVHRSLSVNSDNVNRNTNSVNQAPPGSELDNESDSNNLKNNTRMLDSQFSSGLSDHGEIVYTKEESPLTNMDDIIQIEAIQTGKTLPNDAEKIQEYSNEIELASTPSNIFLDNNFNPTKGVESPSVLKRSESFEDLDSPESICRIDREDCFSWEEDRALLTIDPDPDSKESSGEEKPTTSNDPVLKTVNTPKPEASTDNKYSNNGSFGGESSEKGGKFEKEMSPGRKGDKTAALKSKLSSAFGNLHKDRSKVKDQNVFELEQVRVDPVLQQDQFGFPLAIFAQGYVCYPYLSLQYHDILHNVNLRGFVIGATNILFKQKRNVVDAIIEVSDGKIGIHDREVQKQVHLTTADLRFADCIVKSVLGDESSVFVSGTEWEGGDEWLRAQFRLYLQCLLASVSQSDVKALDDFGNHFVLAWKTTYNYRHWNKKEHIGFKDIPSGHPYGGNLNVADIRVKLAHTMQNTERGKKLNAAVVQTGKYVVQTGKAVGGALNHAKSTLSSWFSSFTPDRNTEKEEDGEPS